MVSKMQAMSKNDLKHQMQQLYDQFPVFFQTSQFEFVILVSNLSSNENSDFFHDQGKITKRKKYIGPEPHMQ